MNEITLLASFILSLVAIFILTCLLVAIYIPLVIDYIQSQFRKKTKQKKNDLKVIENVFHMKKMRDDQRRKDQNYDALAELRDMMSRENLMKREIAERMEEKKMKDRAEKELALIELNDKVKKEKLARIGREGGGGGGDYGEEGCDGGG